MSERKSLLTKEQLSKKLYEYYLEHYGDKDTDVWCDQPAVNVWVFRRNDTYITLKAHILSGEIEEMVETIAK